MKRTFFSVVTCLLLLTFALPLLLCFAQPMDDAVYSFSVMMEDGQEEWGGSNGWIFFTDEAGQVTPLTPDGFGGYNGLSFSGQTFYFSRTLDQALQSPTLRIAVANRTVSVFLDGELLYTDCPELDNRIGYLTLPMLEYDRADPLHISLPDGYTGKTLTIAQSTGLSEKQDAPDVIPTVYPCDVTLFCGYAYESGLIAQAVQVMIPAVLAFSLGLCLLAVFLWQTLADHHSDLSLALLALLAFLLMAGVLLRAPFFFRYFGLLPVDPATLSAQVTVTVFLAFLACRVRRRVPMLALTALHGGLLAVSLWAQLTGRVDLALRMQFLPVSLFALLVALTICLAEARTNRFCRVFSVTLLALSAAAAGIGLLLFVRSGGSLSHLPEIAARYYLPQTLLRLLEPLCLIAGLFAAAVHTVSDLVRRHAESGILAAKAQLAQRSYESLRTQSEQIMMLRHDLNHHLNTLQSLLQTRQPQQAADYIAALIGQNQAVRPMVSCGNPQLDIILNGKLDAAIRSEVRVEIVRAQAPPTLPLDDAELSSLIMNLMDNAVQAAAASPPACRLIRLELHVQHDFFIFSCTNSRAAAAPRPQDAQEIPVHGYGLRIVRRIVERHGGLLRVEPSPDSFHVTFALPLTPPDTAR